MQRGIGAIMLAGGLIGAAMFARQAGQSEGRIVIGSWLAVACVGLVKIILPRTDRS